MDSIVGPIKQYIQKRDPATIDNFAFKLHYRVTFVVMLVCTALVSTRQFIGDPISCISDGVPGGTLDLYCWIHSTFSVKSRWGDVKDEYGEGLPHKVGMNQPHPGVAPPQPDEEVVYHRYYQASDEEIVLNNILRIFISVGRVCFVPAGHHVPHSQDRVEAPGGWADEDAGG